MKLIMGILSPVVFLAILFFSGCKSQSEDPVKYVDPFICTEGDNGQLYPGPAYPFGLVHLSPETEGKSHVGYYYENEYIEGFSHLKIGGGGSDGKGGGLLIKPGVGKFTSKIDEFREKYDKSSEEASLGYYKLVLESGVKAELTVSERVGFHRYTFPSDKKKNRYIVVELSHSYVGMLDAKLNVINNNEITGMIKSLHNRGGHYHKLYFAIVSDTPFEAYTSWKGEEEKGVVPVREGNDIGVWLHFPETGNDVVQLKVGLSPVSEELAMTEAKNEIKGWNFDKVRKDLVAVWREMLSKVEVISVSDEFKTLFYTHLYRSYLVPNNATSSDGMYRAAHREDEVFYTKDTAPDFIYYCTWSLWDDFRKYSLVSLLEPEITRNVVRSLIDHYKHREKDRTSPKRLYWPTPNIRMEFAGAPVMDAWNKGLADGDAEVAFTGMKEDWEQYGEYSLCRAIEKCYHAYFAMRMAEILGKEEEVKTLRDGALAYRKLWCTEQKDNQGNVRGFFTPDGKPVNDVEAMEEYTYEANLWHFRWFVLHDIQGLVNLRGGADLLVDDLEYYFENDFHMALNEPPIHAPFLFNYLGKPYLTQKWARTFTTKEVTQLYHNHGVFDEPVVSRIYRTDTKGFIETMDDDAGTMASWFVMSAMGLFPSDPVEPLYLIGSPIFPELTLHLDNGNSFTIIAKNVSEDNFYIQSARLNGKEYNKPWIEYNTIMAGGTLEFVMGDKPNKAWGSDPALAPPSLSN